jgi:hypothetical protein
MVIPTNTQSKQEQAPEPIKLIINHGELQGRITGEGRYAQLVLDYFQRFLDGAITVQAVEFLITAGVLEEAPDQD